MKTKPLKSKLVTELETDKDNHNVLNMSDLKMSGQPSLCSLGILSLPSPPFPCVSWTQKLGPWGWSLLELQPPSQEEHWSHCDVDVHWGRANMHLSHDGALGNILNLVYSSTHNSKSVFLNPRDSRISMRKCWISISTALWILRHAAG